MAYAALFFDAGNTLVFPNRSCTLAPLLACGVHPMQEQLWAAERTARRERDAAAAACPGRKLADKDYWRIYYTQLFHELQLDPDAVLMDGLVRESHKSSNWEVVLNGTREALLALKERHRLGVISNSDGHMADLIVRVGLGDCFEAVFDSGNLGVEKPDPRIFQIAARQFGVDPADSIYIGDVYSIDYLGARSAGFNAILFDVCGAYRDTGLPRVDSMQQLQERFMP